MAEDDNEEVQIEIELDLEDVIERAARALYEASDEHDPLTMYEMLPMDERESLTAIAAVVLESALPAVTQQIVEAIQAADED